MGLDGSADLEPALSPASTPTETSSSTSTPHDSKSLPPIPIHADDEPDTDQLHQPLTTETGSTITRGQLDNHNEKPLPSMKELPSVPSPSRSPRPNMSLFSSLFSRPKVEKSRGYAEPGLPPTPTWKEASRSKLDLSSVWKSAVTTRLEPPRSESALSFCTNGTNVSHVYLGSQNGPPRDGSKALAWDPPPLFQAFPQSSKHGLAEILTTALETVLARARAGKNKGLEVPSPSEVESRASVESSATGDARRAARAGAKHGGLGLYGHGDLQRKIFVLVTSGYLLQYSEYGPSNRLPEKVLQLGEDSAAFASDSIPGRHHVIQVSHAVDAQGTALPAQGSFFAKWGMRGAAAKRMTSSVLMVLQDAEEMESWLGALRKQIELCGGHNTDEELDSRTGSVQEDDDHSDGTEAASQGPQSTSRPDLVVSPWLVRPESPLPPLPTGESDEEPNAESEDATKDSLDLDDEAEKLAAEAEHVQESLLRFRSASDARSIASSATPSFEQQRLNSLRSSTRSSHGSSFTTMTSRTNSLTSEAPSTKVSFDEAPSSRSPLYRNLASYASAKRRSAMPDASPLVQVQAQSPRRLPDMTDSPVTGRQSKLPTPLSPSAARPSLHSKFSLPDLRSSKQRQKLTVEVHSPVVETGERPVSFVADLPPSSTWSNKHSPKKRMSTIQQEPEQEPKREPKQLHRISSAPALRSPSTSKRSSPPCTLPLRINPSTSANQPPSRNITHATQLFVPILSEDEVPEIHTLEAQIDRQDGRLSMVHKSQAPGDDGPATAIGTTRTMGETRDRSNSTRLSLFPAPPSVPSFSMPLDAPKRRPSKGEQSPPASERVMLKRPASMQIRTDKTPFLSPKRNAGGVSPQVAMPGTFPGANRQRRSFTPPIRALKPSRSKVNLRATMHTLPEDRPLSGEASPTDPFMTPKPSPPTLPESPPDIAALRISRAMSPPPTGGLPPLPASPPLSNSFAQQKTLRIITPTSTFDFQAAPKHQHQRSLRSRASLPALDLGLPIVGLGPPAPPPSAPLPPPPSSPPLGVRPCSPVSLRSSSPMPDASSQIGSIGQALDVTVR